MPELMKPLDSWW